MNPNYTHANVHVSRARPKPSNRLGILLLLFSFLPLLAFAQGADTGSVQGRVQNQLTGRYLEKALVEVVGSDLRVLTNEFGEFRLSNVPAGNQSLRVFYTGLDIRSVPVTVSAGESTQLNVLLTNRARIEEEREFENEEEIFELGVFEVEATEQDAAAIALNEQRFSVNNKEVVSADAFGDVTEGNVGEFVKSLVGVSIEYTAADARSISIRGLGRDFTNVSVNGNRMASAASGGQNRRFELEQVSMNNVSRIEVVKMPTPAMPADSLGGSVNLVPKNAFERDNREIRYRAYFSVNNEDFDFGRTPGPHANSTYKIRPGFDFTYLEPFSADFGIVLNALYSNQFNEQHRSNLRWEFESRNATYENPVLRRYTLQDGPKETVRASVGANFDWRPADNWVVSFGSQYNTYDAQWSNRNINIDTASSNDFNDNDGDNGTYTATSVRGPDFGGRVEHGNSFRQKHGGTIHLDSKVRYYGQGWEADGGLYFSRSTLDYDDMDNGHFERVRVRLDESSAFGDGKFQINFNNIGGADAPDIEVRNSNTGELVDWLSLQNYVVQDARSRPIDSSDQFIGYHANFSKDGIGDLPIEVKTGFNYRQQTREILSPTFDFAFNGVNGNKAATLIADTHYVGQDPHFGFPDIVWPSGFVAYDLYESDPSTFTMNQDYETELAENDWWLEESVTAAYIQAEFKALDNRLSVLGGVRYEGTDFQGEGRLIEDGVIYRRQGKASKDYSGLYPSLHIVYDITPNMLTRLTYAKVMGRPDFSNLFPRSEVDIARNEDDNTVEGGFVNVYDGSLDPWEADTFDVTVEYYLNENRGSIKFAFFHKEITGFFAREEAFITAESIASNGFLSNLEAENPSIDFFATDDEGEPAWSYSYAYNTTELVTLQGFEFALQHNLDFMGEWGKDLDVFFNWTGMKIDAGDRRSNFGDFIPSTGNWGITWQWNNLKTRLRWNYRGRQNLGSNSAVTGGDVIGYRYYDERLYMDINLEYKFSDAAVLFMNARNISQTPQDRLVYNDLVPDYARLERREEFGIQLAIGIKGKF